MYIDSLNFISFGINHMVSLVEWNSDGIIIKYL
jgi:hypothetical protein